MIDRKAQTTALQKLFHIDPVYKYGSTTPYFVYESLYSRSGMFNVMTLRYARHDVCFPITPCQSALSRQRILECWPNLRGFATGNI